MCWSSNIAASGLEPDIRHGASVSKKEGGKQQQDEKQGDCKIEAHASFLFGHACFFFVQADWFASRFALSLPCHITYFTSSFFAALPSVGRRGMYPMEATSCHQTLTPRWRPTKPAVSRRTDAHFRRAALSHRLPPNRNEYSAFEWARRPELLDTLAFCR